MSHAFFLVALGTFFGAFYKSIELENIVLPVYKSTASSMAGSPHIFNKL